MQKELLSMVTGVLSLFLGIAAVALYTVQPEVETRIVSTPAESKLNCEESRSFPGRSVALDEVRKFKNGFFPVNALNDDWENSDDSINSWYGRFLRAMDEKSLLNVWDENKEAYRFLWLRTFDHPVMIRMERDGYSFQLLSVELSGKGGYEPGRRWRTDHVMIYPDDWCKFMFLLEKASYWSMETNQRDDIGLDGSQWVLESVRMGRYHIVDRWTPRDGDYRKACLFLLELSGRDLKALGEDLY